MILLYIVTLFIISCKQSCKCDLKNIDKIHVRIFILWCRAFAKRGILLFCVLFAVQRDVFFSAFWATLKLPLFVAQYVSVPAGNLKPSVNLWLIDLASSPLKCQIWFLSARLSVNLIRTYLFLFLPSNAYYLFRANCGTACLLATS